MDVLSVEKLQLFLVIVLPGFVAIKVFDVFSPPEKRDFGSSLIEAVVYGLLNFACWAWYLVGVTMDDAKSRPVLHSVMLLVTCVLSPGLLAYVFMRIRKTEWACKRFGLTTKSA